MNANIYNYEYLGLINHGVFGYVIKAYSFKNDILVAIKRTQKVGNKISREYENLMELKDSNNIVKIIDIFYTINNKKIPKWLRLLKYSSVVSLSITFLVVLFILFPMSGFNVYGMFLFGTLLYHHLICPILCFVTFIFYDEIYDFIRSEEHTSELQSR